ncbi:MAG: type III pantothenate kinase [Thermodesulfovibrionales bacterium]|nr:type III pantothenate kinase [Thermodesulfovibrionales bacterium]
MLIAIDIGNSSINIGFFTDSGLSVQRLDTLPLLTVAEYTSLFDTFLSENDVEKTSAGVILSSVVPGHTRVFRETLKQLIAADPLVVNCTIDTGLIFDIPEPEKLGSDRIANAVAAHELQSGPVVIADFGTATTISIMNDSHFIGGAIIPGIRLMNESLARQTAQLPKVPLTPLRSALGTNTTHCIQSGLLFGTAGGVERIVSEIEQETGLPFRVIVTGGYGSLISSFLKKKHTLHPYLTLNGLKILYMRNTHA